MGGEEKRQEGAQCSALALGGMLRRNSCVPSLPNYQLPLGKGSRQGVGGPGGAEDGEDGAW